MACQAIARLILSTSPRFDHTSFQNFHSYSTMHAIWLGSVDYADCWQLQRELADLRASRQSSDLLLLLEHPPTITLGRGSNPSNVLASKEVLESSGIALHSIDRGGDVTYHGPGQLIGYPIIDLTNYRRDLHWFLRRMEEALIQTLASFGLEGRRFPPHTGVWIGDEKVAAIGIKVSRWVSTHGFALNVAPDLGHFDLIIPCGIEEYGVTSMSTASGRIFSVVDVVSAVAHEFDLAFPSRDDGLIIDASELSESSQKIFRNGLDAAGTLC
jgi:lipoyl(octanoyl) transferase